tara:strand:+ start:540 stop:896 length:357 start_codon:yes stop_codon:yes gene_type:complete
MGLANSLRKVANKTVQKLGGDVIYRRIAVGSYSTSSGVISESITSFTIKGVVEDVNASEVNDLIKSTDKRLTIAAAALDSAPSTSDEVQISGSIHQIIQIQTIEQDNQNISHVLILRS